MAVKAPVITEREQNMLLLVYQFKYLSLPLLTRGLGYAASSINHVGECAKGLYEKKLLYRFPLPSTTKGTRSFIYTLTASGMKIVRTLGVDVDDGWTVSSAAPTYMHFAHTLVTNELVIAATLLPSRVAAIRIRKALVDWQLRKYQIRLKDDNGYLTMIPDGLLDIRFIVRGSQLQALLWLEVDRGTEQMKQLKRKIFNLYSIGSNANHLTVLGTQSITFAFATTEGEHRRVVLESWIEQELARIGKTQDADMFLTATIAPGNIDPVKIYISPRWTVPFTKEKVPLIDLSV